MSVGCALLPLQLCRFFPGESSGRTPGRPHLRVEREFGRRRLAASARLVRPPSSVIARSSSGCGYFPTPGVCACLDGLFGFFFFFSRFMCRSAQIFFTPTPCLIFFNNICATRAGWGRSVTPNGELYYVNHVSKTTTWSRPQWTTGSDGDDECESRDAKTLSLSGR